MTYSFSLDVTSQTLVNKTHNIGWYFWSTKEGANTLYYLANGRKNNNIRVWNFTTQRKWKPIHNAPTFDGFTKANKNFDKISFSSDGKKITFKNKNISTNIAIDYYLETLQNKTFDITWYFWESNSYPFLASGRDSESGMKIWQYTVGGKWRPIHNTGPYDDFIGAGNIFDEVDIDDGGWTIKIVKNSYDIPTIQKDSSFPKGDNVYPSFTIYSKDFKSGEDYAGGFPHIRWASLPLHTKSMAIEIIDTSATNYSNVLYRAMNIAVDVNKTSISNANVPTPGLVLPNDIDNLASFIQPTAKHTISINVYAIKIEKASSFLNAKENALSHRTLLYRVP
jgi:phosphatidylethanolamine-binding protein (PEBP) family uncharacterized protein